MRLPRVLRLAGLMLAVAGCGGDGATGQSDAGPAAALRGWVVSHGVYGPDGTAVAAVASDPDARPRAVVIRDGRIIARTPDDVDAYQVGWYPTGDALLVSAVGRTDGRYLLLRLGIDGSQQRIALDRPLWPEDAPTVSPDSASAVVSASTSERSPRAFDLWRVDLASGRVARAYGRPAVDEGAPVFVSPDRLVVTLGTGAGDGRRIRLATVDLPSGRLTALTEPALMVGTPSVDPTRGIAVFDAYERADVRKRGVYGVRLDRPGARLLLETQAIDPSLDPARDRVLVTTVGGAAGIGGLREMPIELGPLLRAT